MWWPTRCYCWYLSTFSNITHSIFSMHTLELKVKPIFLIQNSVLSTVFIPGIYYLQPILLIFSFLLIHKLGHAHILSNFFNVNFFVKNICCNQTFFEVIELTLLELSINTSWNVAPNWLFTASGGSSTLFLPMHLYRNCISYEGNFNK